MVLAEAGQDVVEVSAGKHSRGAKNDPSDAVRAARTALAREQQAEPRARGLREALRQVLVTRQAILVSRAKAINELTSLIVLAPEHLRAVLRGAPLATQRQRIAAGTEFLLGQIHELDSELAELVTAHPGRTGSARRARCRAGRGCAAAGELVAPRTCPR